MLDLFKKNRNFLPFPHFYCNSLQGNNNAGQVSSPYIKLLLKVKYVMSLEVLCKQDQAPSMEQKSD